MSRMFNVGRSRLPGYILLLLIAKINDKMQGNLRFLSLFFQFYMGVCPIQHRIVTGRYNSRSFISPKKYCNKPMSPKTNNYNCEVFLWILFGIMYLYQVCLLMGIFIEISKDQKIPMSYIPFLD